MKRVPELIDVWFDFGLDAGGAVAFPFENQSAFEEEFPADYICEAVDQTTRAVLFAARHRHDAF